MASINKYQQRAGQQWFTPPAGTTNRHCHRFQARSGGQGAVTPGSVGGQFTPPAFDLSMAMPEGEELDEMLESLEAKADLRKKQARFQLLTAGLEQGATDFSGTRSQVNKHTCSLANLGFGKAVVGTFLPPF